MHMLGLMRVRSARLCTGIENRIDYKIAVLAYKTVKMQQPSYLFDWLSVHQSNRSLRSVNKGLQFTIPFIKTETASRDFSVYAPKLINSLPKHIRDMFPSNPVTESVSVDCLSMHLKHFYFSLFLLMLHSFFSGASVFCLACQT